MRTLRKLRYRLRSALLQRQCVRLMARVRREQARADRASNPGYDELSNPWFLGVMAAAVLVLLVDIPDAWPTVTAVLVRLAGA